MDNLPCPPIASRPEWTLQAFLAFGVINPFFMWAPDDVSRHRNSSTVVRTNEFEDLFVDERVEADITGRIASKALIRLFS